MDCHVFFFPWVPDQREHRGNPFKYVRLCRFSSNLGDVFSFQTQKIPYCLGGVRQETNGPTPPWDGWHNQDTCNIILMNKRPKFDLHLEKIWRKHISWGDSHPEVWLWKKVSEFFRQIHHKIRSELSRYGIGRPKMTLKWGAKNHEFLFKVQLFPWPFQFLWSDKN